MPLPAPGMALSGRAGSLGRGSALRSRNTEGAQMKAALILLAAVFPMAAMAQSADPVWVPGSSQKVCQPNGETDYQTNQPTVSRQQPTNGGPGEDVGGAFEHKSKQWFLFGDTT